MIFTLMDILATAIPQMSGSVEGYLLLSRGQKTTADFHHSINPYWKLALIFKCLTDNIVLDDFSTELKRIGGGASLPLEPAQEYEITHFAVPEKQQGALAEVENAGSSVQRPESDGSRIEFWA